MSEFVVQTGQLVMARSPFFVGPIVGITLLCSLPFAKLDAAEADPVARANEILLELQRYNSQLEELESQFGPFDNSLIEPLNSIVTLLIEQGDYEAALQIQTRQLGLMRTVLGLEHLDLIPVLEAINNYRLYLGQTDEVDDNLGLIHLIVVANYGADSDETLQSLDTQAQWALDRLTIEQDDQEQARSFMRARELYEEIVDRAESRYGEDSPELIPWYYKRAHNLALLVGLLNTDDSLSGEVIDEVIREDGYGRLELGSNRSLFDPDISFGPSRRFAVVNGDEVFGVAYLRQGRGFISDMQDIAEQQGDLELQGLLEIYRGDFNVMMDRTSGSRNYREARELLIEAGIEAERIDRFFASPMPIPVPEFYGRFAEFEAYQLERLGEAGAAEEGLTHLGRFTAWSESAPALERPRNDEPWYTLDQDPHVVELKFRLTSRGSPISVDVLRADTEEVRVQREATRALRDIQFRPYFANGRSRGLRDLQIRYEYIYWND